MWSPLTHFFSWNMIRNFSADYNVVLQNQPVVLRWRVLGAEDIVLAPMQWKLADEGEMILRPHQDTIYTLTAVNGAQRQQSTIFVAVKPLPLFTNMELPAVPDLGACMGEVVGLLYGLPNAQGFTAAQELMQTLLRITDQYPFADE